MDIYGAHFINTSQEVIFTDHQNYHRYSNLSIRSKGLEFTSKQYQSHSNQCLQDSTENTYFQSLL